MIRSLKWKFVFVIMAMAALLLTLVFGSVYVTTSRALYQNSVIVLSRALGEMTSAPGSTLQETTTPYFTVLVQSDNTVVVMSGNYISLDQDAVVQLCKLCRARPDGVGTIERYGVRYMKETAGDTLKIAFVDITVEQGTRAALLANSIVIAMACMSVLFFMSLVFATEAVKPIADSMAKQRQFIADASHELNTPLTVIISNIGLMASDEKYAGDERLERLMYETKRMKKLTQDLLCLARSDNADPKSVVLSTFSLSDEAEEAALFFEPLIFDEGKRLVFEGDKEAVIRGSTTQIKQLIEILLDNARKYSYPDSEIRLTVSRHTRSKKVILAVHNFGDTIPADKLSAIFERFYRADSARKENGGYGLGLSIAKSIAAQHGGSISATSADGEGTTFTVTLPLTKRSD